MGPRVMLASLVLAFTFAASAHAQPPAPTSATPQTVSPQTGAPGVPTTPTQTRPGVPRRDPILPGPEAGTGSIRGRVVALDTGQPLRRVQVRLQGGNLRQGRTALSDTQGAFEFKNLGTGRYNLSATKGGYVTLQYGQRGPNDTGRMLDVADGQNLSKIDMALPRGAVIVGRIVDETGEAIADVPVAAMQYRMMNGRRRLVPMGRTAMTNDIGQFRLFGLPPGEYYVSASMRQGMMMMDAPADDPTGYAPTFYPGTPSVAEAQRLTIGIGEEVSADMQLTPIKLVRVSGTVNTSDGKPAANGFISLQNRSPDSMGPMMGGGGTIIRPDGTFQMNGVAPGTYTLVANVNLPDSGGDAQAREVGQVPLSVGQDLTDVRIHTTRGIVISGRLTFDGGRAPEGTNLRQIRPICVPVDPERLMMANSSQPMPPDEAGQFEIKGVVGKCLLTAYGMQQGWTMKSVTLNGSDITDRPIEAGNKAIGGVEIMLTKNAATIGGSVQDVQNQPSKDYTVIIFPEDRDKWVPELSQRYFRRVRPDQQGVFKATGLPPGRYLVAAFDAVEPGAEMDPEFLTRAQASATRTEVSQGGTQNLSLKINGPAMQ
jgi:hypothetical protein